MPVRDLTVLFNIIDRGSKILDPLLNKLDELDGREVIASADIDTSSAVAGASALESSLDSLQGANEKLTGSMEKVAGSADKEGKEAESAGKKTKASGESAKQATGLYGQLQKTLDATANKFDTLSSKIEPFKGKLLGIQAVITGLAAVSVMSSAKTESLVDELKGLKGEDFAAPIIEWAGEAKGKAWTSKSQRLMIGADLSEMGYNADEVKSYGTEIEKFFFQKSAMLKRQGVANAEELARTIAAAEKSGNLESVKRLFSSGAISEEKLSRETDRLRMNYEKFAFATDEVVKKQAMHNLMMKELSKTNKDFTGEARTLEQKLDVLQSKFSGLLSGIGDKLKPTVMMAVDGLVMLIDAVESVPGHDEILVFLGALLVILTTLATAAMGLAPLFGFFAGAVGVVGAIASAPLLPIVAALALIAAALYLIYTRTTLLQDGYSRLRDLTGKTLASILRLFGLTSSSLKGNKESINELFSLIRNWLDGLIPGWLNDLLAKGEGIYREAMGWFTKIMGWWSEFLGKVTEVYDKVKGIFNLGKGGQEVTPEMQKYGVTGWGSVNGEKAVKVAYRELPTSQWSTPIYDQIRAATGGKTRLTGKEYLDFAQKYPELAKAMTATGEIQVPLGDIGDYGIPESALPPEPTGPLGLPDVGGAINESGQDYVEKASQTYKETLDKTGSETAAAYAAWDPIGFYVGLGKKALGQGAGGATVHQAGGMIVHPQEEIIPARITQGVGKLGSLLAIAMDSINSRADLGGQLTPEKIFSQSIGSGSVQVTLQIPSIEVNNFISRDVDLRNLDITKMIDWHKISYELEKMVRNTFRTQQG